MATQALFSKNRLSDYLTQRLTRARAEVARESAASIAADPEAVIQSMVARLKLEPLVFNFDEMIHSDAIETTVQVQAGGRVAAVPAMAFEYTIPFTGTTDLLWLQPSTWSSAPQPAVELRGKSVVLEFASRDISAEWVKAELSTARGRIVNSLEQSSSDVVRWNAELEGTIAASVRARAAQLSKGASIAQQLDD
jgi:hypothetical protein